MTKEKDSQVASQFGNGQKYHRYASCEGVKKCWETSELVSAHLASESLVENVIEHLPKSVKVLTSPEGAEVYLVGTAHHSGKSQEEVAKVMRLVRPHILVLELCQSRSSVIHRDTEHFKIVTKRTWFGTIRMLFSLIKRRGFFYGLTTALVLRVTEKRAEKFGRWGGAEFSTAYQEALKLPTCVILFGDRQTNITDQRFLSMLSIPRYLGLLWRLVTHNCKYSLWMTLIREFEEAKIAYHHERNIYLTYSLQLATQFRPKRSLGPARVVGVVGLEHVPGIARMWFQVNDFHISKIIDGPPPSKTSGAVKFLTTITILGLVLWGVNKHLDLITVPTNNLEYLGKFTQTFLATWKEAVLENSSAISDVLTNSL